jgi:hypothetical protein
MRFDLPLPMDAPAEEGGREGQKEEKEAAGL